MKLKDLVPLLVELNNDPANQEFDVVICADHGQVPENAGTPSIEFMYEDELDIHLVHENDLGEYDSTHITKVICL